jgi:hypothetical protein
MALRIDIDALFDELTAKARAEAVDPATSTRSLRPDRGGVRAAVTTGAGTRTTHDCWVGIVNGQLMVDCECRTDERSRPCAHAAVVTRAAVDAGLPLSGSASVPAMPRDEAEWTEVADQLSHRELVRLVARQAVRDRVFANAVLDAADLLGPPGPAEIAAVREAIDDALAVESGYEWDLHDIATAGFRLADELELLAQRPATPEALSVAVAAIEAWDGHLYGILSQDYRTYETEPADIGGRIAAAHLAMCESLPVDPLRLAADLVRLQGIAEIESSVDPAAYRHLLGPAGAAAEAEGRGQLRRTRGW